LNTLTIADDQAMKAGRKKGRQKITKGNGKKTQDTYGNEI